MILLWLVGCFTSALWAQDKPWYAGERVSQVQLLAPEMGLPEENTQQLLRVQEGEILDPEDVRRDVILLYRIGQFSSVEAMAIPWSSVNDEGDVVPSVVVRYQVLAAPRLGTVRVVSDSAAARRMVRRSLPLNEGDVFYAADESREMVSLLKSVLDRAGWSDAEVSLEFGKMKLGVRDLTIQVKAGEPETTGPITVAGEMVRDEGTWRNRRASGRITSRKALRWLWWEGVREGQRLDYNEAENAQTLVEDQLSRRGWRRPQADMWFLPKDEATNVRALSVIVRGGERLLVQTRGIGLPRGEELDALVSHVPGMRVDELFSEDVEQRLLERFYRKGYRDAKVMAQLVPMARGQRLIIESERGPLSTVSSIEVEVYATEPDANSLLMGSTVGMSEPAYKPRFIAGAIREATPESLGDGLVSDHGIMQAIRSIEELYRGNGYLSASAELVEERTIRQRFGISWGTFIDPSELYFRVIEGPQTTLNELNFEGDLGVGQVRMEAASSTLVGQPYGPAKLDDLARELVDLYRQQGYLQADARVDSDLSADALSVDSTIRIEPGEQVRMRSLVLQGLHRTKSKVVKRELELTLGEPITSVAMAETRSQLYALDLFSVVRIDLVGEDNRSRDVFLQLEERPNILLETGGGMSTDLGALVRGRAIHRNLMGLGHRFSVVGEVGYAWQGGDDWRLDWDEPVSRLGMVYEAPYLPIRRQSLVIEGVIKELIQEPSWRMSRSGAYIGLQSRGLNWGESWLRYRVLWRHLEDVGPGVLVMQDPWVETLGLDNLQISELNLPSDSRLHMGPEWIVRVDRRDDPYNAVSGSLFTSQVRWNHGPIAAPASVRAESRWMWLQPAGPVRLALIGRAGIGWARGESTLPLDDRFYLGGSSLRGFNLNSVGPANLVPRSDVDFSPAVEPIVEGMALRSDASHWVPTGGDSLLALQLELRVPLNVLGLHGWDTTSLVAFSDWGHVGFVDPNVQTSSQGMGLDPWVRGSVGLGVKWSTPIGPATLELGMNLNPMDDRVEPRFVPNIALGEL